MLNRERPRAAGGDAAGECLAGWLASRGRGDGVTESAGWLPTTLLPQQLPFGASPCLCPRPDGTLSGTTGHLPPPGSCPTRVCAGGLGAGRGGRRACHRRGGADGRAGLRVLRPRLGSGLSWMDGPPLIPSAAISHAGGVTSSHGTRHPSSPCRPTPEASPPESP